MKTTSLARPATVEDGTDAAWLAFWREAFRLRVELQKRRAACGHQVDADGRPKN